MVEAGGCLSHFKSEVERLRHQEKVEIKTTHLLKLLTVEVKIIFENNRAVYDEKNIIRQSNYVFFDKNHQGTIGLLNSFSLPHRKCEIYDILIEKNLSMRSAIGNQANRLEKIVVTQHEDIILYDFPKNYDILVEKGLNYAFVTNSLNILTMVL